MRLSRELFPSPDISERERKGRRREAQQQVFHCERSPMAEDGRPGSGLYPPVGAASLESMVSGQSLSEAWTSSTQAVTPPTLVGGPGCTCQEEPKEAVSEICTEYLTSSSLRGIHRSSAMGSGEPGAQDQSSSERCVTPPSLTEQTASHQHEVAVNAINNSRQAGRTVQSMTPASLPVHRSHSETLPQLKQGVPPPAPDSARGLASYGAEKSIQDAESHSKLACKQPMQLQQCNIITTMCRGATVGEAGAQQPQSRCVCSSAPKVEGAEEKGHLSPKCDKALCCCSYIHHANFEETFAAYCHPQPIPAPSQLLPRLAGAEPSCNIQRAVAPPSAMSHLTLPRLISSVSETGLDAKHLLRCCNLNCSWISTLPSAAGPQPQKHFGPVECCSSLGSQVRTTTRDTGTMTAHKELRDVGVQTGHTATAHVFPTICLAEENSSETSCCQTPNSNSDGGKKLRAASKSPVKEVKWDAEGMTWEVYGASVDPEELGLAIQKHLELQIKETASHAAKLTRQNTNTSRQNKDMGGQRKRSRMMASIRPPACCSRSTTAVD